MEQLYIAHINETSQAVQTVKEHSENTANLCREFAVPIWKDFSYNVGVLHDIGKYQKDFQKRINGANIQVEHSTCGAFVARDKFTNVLGLLMEYCIAGHHGGLPDGGSQSDDDKMPTLSGRLKRSFEDFSQYEKELSVLPIQSEELIKLLAEDCNLSIGKRV